MSETCLLNVIIINYKTPEMTIDCLSALFLEINTIDSHVTIVDNASEDSSVESLSKWIETGSHQERVSLIQSKENTGFSGGNNIGIRHKSAKYYLLLNSDTLVRPGSIAQLLNTAEKYPRAGLISPKLEWPDGKPQESCFRFHSPFSEMIASAHTSTVTKILKRYDVPINVSNEITTPEWTSFACVLVRAEVIKQVGLMDDGYFLYYEDCDYCKMAKKGGWFVINDPAARVIHLRGGSGNVKSNIKANRRVPRYYYESRARYMYKAYGPLGPLIANLMWVGGRIISWVRERVGSKEVTVCEGQWVDIWINTLKR